MRYSWRPFLLIYPRCPQKLVPSRSSGSHSWEAFRWPKWAVPRSSESTSPQEYVWIQLLDYFHSGNGVGENPLLILAYLSYTSRCPWRFDGVMASKKMRITYVMAYISLDCVVADVEGTAIVVTCERALAGRIELNRLLQLSRMSQQPVMAFQVSHPSDM
jgi:hypothetical protein